MRVFPFLGVPCGIFQTPKYIVLGDLLRIGVGGKRGGSEFLTIVPRQCILVRQEPRFHTLNHEMNIVVCRASGFIPFIAGSAGKEFPRAGAGRNRFLTVNQEDNEFPRSTFS